jgi:hypothetical protein
MSLNKFSLKITNGPTSLGVKMALGLQRFIVRNVVRILGVGAMVVQKLPLLI